jgi:hypothetical protein
MFNAAMGLHNMGKTSKPLCCYSFLIKKLQS